MSWNPKYAILILTSTIITYLSGLLIEKANNSKNEKRKIFLKRLFLTLSLIINLGILFFFKYYNFFANEIALVFSKINIFITFPKFDLILPVGISFYTFQALSYSIDVYRNDIKAERNFGKYALFVSFFPQLVAGPIEKSKDLLNQFKLPTTFDYERFKDGLFLMLWGFFQKIVVADRLAILVNKVYENPSNYYGFEIILLLYFLLFKYIAIFHPILILP